MGHAPKYAVIILTWLFGTLSGALWMATLEREDHKSAQLYGRFMVFCYFLCLVAIALSS
jgi:hypothetical protein